MYKNILLSQKKLSSSTKSEILRLKVKLEDIQKTHEQEINKTKEILLLEFNEEKSLALAQMKLQYDKKAYEDRKQIQEAKEVEIENIKLQLANEIKTIESKSEKEVNKLQKLLTNEKLKVGENKEKFEKILKSKDIQHQSVS